MNHRIALAGALAAVATAAGAQDYPSGTVEMIVPFSAGGGTDTVARAFEPPFAEALGGTIVIRNVDGASGTIGATEAAGADADGYTIGYLPIGPVAIQPLLRPLSYDSDSFAYVCQTTDNPVFLMVSQDSGIGSLEELAAREPIIYGSSGPGTIPHLAMAGLASSMGVEATHVPYDGTGPAMNALAGGEIVAFADVPSVLEANAVTPLAIFADDRHADYPDVPTMDELGHNLQFSVWQGVFAPQGTDQATLDALSVACQTAVESEAFTQAAETMNTEVRYRDPAAFQDFVSGNVEANRRILEEAGLVE